MRTPRSLCGFLVVALLAGSQTARAQRAPSYRPPATSSPSTASTSGSAQCGGGAPAGASTVKQGNGNVPAPKSGQPAYTQVPLSLANYAVGGQLTIQLTVGSGGSPATFELFPASTTFAANGTPSARPVATQANVAPASCATLTYNFSQPGSYILAVAGTSGSNTFQYSAYVLPSFTGVFSAPPATAQPLQTAPAPPAPAPSAPQQSIFDGVFSPPPASPSPAPSSPSPAPAQPSSPSSVSSPVIIQSVWIQNSPGVPDTGGHCIICGLVTGNLTAVEPNLVVCVTPSGRKDEDRSCTGVCPPGHDCKSQLSDHVLVLSSNPSVHVQVLDNDKDGKITQLAAFDESDPSQCTKDQPCKVDDSDDQGAGTLVSFEFGSLEGCEAPATGSNSDSTSGSLWTPGPILIASTTFFPGLLPAQTPTSGATLKFPLCTLSFTSYSNDITSEQLYSAFLTLWGNGTPSEPGSQLFRDNVGKIPSNYQVNVLVVDESDPQFATQLVPQAEYAYSFFNARYKNKDSKVASYRPPNQDEFAYTIRPDPTPDPVTKKPKPPAISVVISAQFLENAWYPTSGVIKVKEIDDLPLPIQLTLAYELGSNAFGMATDNNYQEHPRQTTTNCIMEQAFGEQRAVGGAKPRVVQAFAPNIMTDDDDYTIASAVLFRAPQHGIYDELTGGYFQTKFGGANTSPKRIYIYSNSTYKYETPPQDIYVPPVPTGSKAAGKKQPASAPPVVQPPVRSPCDPPPSTSKGSQGTGAGSGASAGQDSGSIDLGPPAQIVSPQPPQSVDPQPPQSADPQPEEEPQQ